MSGSDSVASLRNGWLRNLVTSHKEAEISIDKTVTGLLFRAPHFGLRPRIDLSCNARSRSVSFRVWSTGTGQDRLSCCCTLDRLMDRNMSRVRLGTDCKVKDTVVDNHGTGFEARFN